MRNSIFAILAIAAVSTSAFATDLPSKTSAPEFPVSEYTETLNVISGSLTSNFVANEYDEVSDFDYTLGYTFLGLGNGIAVGGNIVANGTGVSDIEAKRVEVNTSLNVPAGFGFSTVVGGGLGYRIEEEDAYYVLNTGINYQVNDFVTLNAIGYQFRDNFDNTWQSHEVGTGVTIRVVDNVNVTTKIARSYDEDLEATSDSVTIGVGIGF